MNLTLKFNLYTNCQIINVPHQRIIQFNQNCYQTIMQRINMLFLRVYKRISVCTFIDSSFLNDSEIYSIGTKFRSAIKRGKVFKVSKKVS